MSDVVDDLRCERCEAPAHERHRSDPVLCDGCADAAGELERARMLELGFDDLIEEDE
jgi:hypothetical protein